MASRTDSLAVLLQKQDLFDEYFLWCFQTKPSFAERMEWMEEHRVGCSAGALSRLHKSDEAAEWRQAAAAKAVEQMDKFLPGNIHDTIRKSLLNQRYNAVLGELSHEQLMDHLSVETNTAELKVKHFNAKMKAKALKLAERRVAMGERKLDSLKGTLENGALSDEQRVQRMKRVFGLS